MKVQATALLTFQAKSLAGAGAVLDDVLTRAREMDDVDVGRVEVASPPADRAVTLPPVPAAGGGSSRRYLASRSRLGSIRSPEWPVSRSPASPSASRTRSRSSSLVSSRSITSSIRA